LLSWALRRAQPEQAPRKQKGPTRRPALDAFRKRLSDQRFENWKLRRALARPYFLRSTTRGSRVRKPAALTALRSAGSNFDSAWAMPGTAKVSGLSETIERFAYGVVLGGRLYTVEARAPKGKVDDDAKAAAKAVAATLFRPADAPVGPPEGSADPGPAQTAE
jgi:hypothetical protein